MRILSDDGPDAVAERPATGVPPFMPEMEVGQFFYWFEDGVGGAGTAERSLKSRALTGWVAYHGRKTGVKYSVRLVPHRNGGHLVYAVRRAR
jgi:hypothetical protein